MDNSAPHLITEQGAAGVFQRWQVYGGVAAV
jgi:hypothetical protein